MKILSLMQFVPLADGIGGEQRAWFLLKALARLGEVHLVVVEPTKPGRRLDVDVSALEAVAATVTLHRIPEWARVSDLSPIVHRRVGGWLDYLRMGTPHTPRLRRAALRALAERIPACGFDVAFAGRLPAAMMIDALCAEGLLDATRRIADFDDVLSTFFGRELGTIRWTKLDRRLAKTIDVAMIRKAEARVLATWDGVSVCNQGDVAALEERGSRALVQAIPNVVDRPLLPPAPESGRQILFVGNLRFDPNAQGLERFVNEAWPKVRSVVPGARLQVVGLDPPEGLRAKLSAAGADLDANVPSVEPFYRAADVVIAPIFFGGGTRIKIIEAMAYGRAVVATPIGAEGLGLESGVNAMIADTMEGFADAVVRLLRDPALRLEMAGRARDYQQEAFGPGAMASALGHLFADGGVSNPVML